LKLANCKDNVLSVIDAQPSNIPVERDRPKAALWGSLRGFAAPAAPHLQR